LPPEPRRAGVTDKEIVLGTHLDLSGPWLPACQHIRNGMQMRLDEANEAGGIHGRKIRLVVEDNASQPQLAVRATDKLLRKRRRVRRRQRRSAPATNAAAVKKRGRCRRAVFRAMGRLVRSSRKDRGNSPLLFTTTPNYDVIMNTGVDLDDQDTYRAQEGRLHLPGRPARRT
jgi:branched-chain amino acid transport system substrate-binding protein